MGIAMFGGERSRWGPPFVPGGFCTDSCVITSVERGNTVLVVDSSSLHTKGRARFSTIHSPSYYCCSSQTMISCSTRESEKR